MHRRGRDVNCSTDTQSGDKATKDATFDCYGKVAGVEEKKWQYYFANSKFFVA